VHIKEAYHNLIETLKPLYGNRESSNISDWVIEHVTGWNRSKRLVYHDASLTDEQLEKFNSFKSELQQARPVQYVLGECWFAGMAFFVDERVLIPRPETEELVDFITKKYLPLYHSKESGFKLLDIGTGSGCIAIALKKNFPLWEIHAIDDSQGAMHVAAINAEKHSCPIHFTKADITLEIENETIPSFEVIVSNPPYIPISDMLEMEDHVLKYEPHQALFVTDNDPLQFYKKIISFSMHHLLRGGMLFFETHSDYANDVANVLEENDFEQIEIKQDLQGRDRIVCGKKTGASL
jgi:release factor glutamine methyltransferase